MNPFHYSQIVKEEDFYQRLELDRKLALICRSIEMLAQ
jgi:hypothetical protein